MDNTQDKAINLHRILFSQLEKLSEDSLVNKENINIEMQRTKGICQLSDQILRLANLGLRKIEVEEHCGSLDEDMPRLLS